VTALQSFELKRKSFILEYLWFYRAKIRSLAVCHRLRFLPFGDTMQNRNGRTHTSEHHTV